MSEPDLIQQQRELLRQFRGANQQRIQTEVEAETRRKTARTAADTALDRTQKVAIAQQVKVNADAEARRKADRHAADIALTQVRQTSATQLAAVRKAQGEAQPLLAQAGLQSLLDQTPADLPPPLPNIDPSKGTSPLGSRGYRYD